MESKRIELQKLVDEARELLAVSGAEQDSKAYRALLDMTNKAQGALDGKKFPFTCQREFWKRTEEDEIAFYLEHTTMAPSFRESDKPVSPFGLKEMIHWYRNRDLYSSEDPCNTRLNVNTNIDGNFYLSNKEMERIKKKIENNPLFQEKYKELKEIADQTTLEQCQRWYAMNRDGADYTMLREEAFTLWKNCGYGANLTTPSSAVCARLSVVLPSYENMEEGLGYIDIRDIFLKSSNGEYINIDVRTENGELHIENKTSADNAIWNSDIFDVKSATGYSLSFDAKQEGKFKEGAIFRVTYYDEQGTEVDQYEYLYNKKSWIPVKKNYNLAMQCNAIVYMVTGDVSYAQKSKYQMLHALDDMCQGAYYWMTYSERPECDDSYGAVQAGRNLCSFAVSYSLIEKADVFTEEEKNLFYELIDFMLIFVLDMRDRTIMSFERAQQRTGNWHTDMCIGASMIICALKDFPDMDIWLDNAYAVVNGQLISNLNEDGSWPESIRYHHAVLEHIMDYSRVLNNMTDIKYLENPKLHKMFEYAIDLQTPPYEYFDNCISTPAFGDHKLSSGEEFSIHGQCIDEMKEWNPRLADRMYFAWEAAHNPIPKFWGERIAINTFLYPDNYQPSVMKEEKLDSINKYEDAGIYVFRNERENGKKDYLAVMSSKKRIGHGHMDQGSFILFKENVPVVMDTGIEGYFNVSTPWHKGSYSHACMLFASEKVEKEKVEGFINLTVGNFTREHGFWDTPYFSKVLSNSIGGTVETISIEIPHVEEEGKQIRTIEVDKENKTWTILDKVEDYQGKVMFSLPLVAKSVNIEGNHIYMEGYYGVTLEVEVKSNFERIVVENGKTIPVYPSDEKTQYLSFVRIHADAADGFHVVIK